MLSLIHEKEWFHPIGLCGTTRDTTRDFRDKTSFWCKFDWISVGIPKDSKGKKALKLGTWGTHYLTLPHTSLH